MPVYRWERKIDKYVVVAPHGPDSLLNELRRLYNNGCVDIHMQQERGTDKWHVEATRFVRVEEDDSDHNAWMEH